MERRSSGMFTAAVVSLVCLFTALPVFAENQDAGSDSHTQVQHQSEKQEMWTCPMHPEIQQSEPGKCPKCKMNLVQNEADRKQEHKKSDYNEKNSESDKMGHSGHLHQ